MKRVALLLVVASLASSLGCVPTARTQQPGGAPDTIRKVSRVMTWEPGPEGTQVPLWPEGVAIQRPESDRPEAVGNGSKLVAGRPWTWASYVSRPTMTIYQDAADRESSRPSFAILLYPGHLWAAKGAKQDLQLSPWVEISAAAPPTLLIHAMNDPTGDVRHSLAYGLALHDAGVPVDMRLYATGGHAFGLRPTLAPITTEWPGQVMQWLRAIKIF